MQAGLDRPGEVDPARIAVLAGTGVGGITTLEDQIAVRVERGPSRVSPFLVPMMMANATAGLLSMRHGFAGASLCISTACASGANAIGEGRRMIRSGGADVVLAGGTEAAITADHHGRVRPHGCAEHPQRRPGSAPPGRSTATATASSWAKARRSWCSSGGTVAERRGATILGELAGYGATLRRAPHHRPSARTAPGRSPACGKRSTTPGSRPPTIGHVNAHGTSTPLNDLAESEALTKVFGADGPPITSTKGVTGHLVGAAGAVEAVLGLLAASRRPGAADRQPRDARPRDPASTSWPASRARSPRRPCCPTRSASAATTPRSSSCLAT